MQLNAVLFDLDGTLLDTAPDFFVVVNQLCQRHGWPQQDYPSIRNTVSHGSRALITLVSGIEVHEPVFESLRDELLALYINHIAVKTTFFDGMEAVIDWLESENIHWGIVTNKPRLYTELLLEQLQLSQRCSTVVCPDDVSATKPDPEPLFLACQQLNIAPANTLYVGDHRRDIEAGQRAGMQTVAANYGYIDHSDPAASWGASHFVEHASELLPLLQNTQLFSR
ncbi:HAD-IA family hydrolase [Dasania sp. GY-MA-18]|uniref:HAD-IA family hydrolase n=1 Tax=Dasania phycosphaerae TaxID=2950436 RepID=A0A9J6RRC7_9GAMM|nr:MULTISPECIES: HAD-IA family hydrolase [Dasania]MCR8924253.1 HAD-IA family hydrolase [Dasania sp. GY-MA-18]MCZ0866906.1 HAD-IA family hydrolase [Dasania phycosphaerae]MCZ0870410.1 HAD-IA family hydrolase [Dasania phycosphaerae]